MKKSIAVLGLGKYGASLAKNMYEMGADVLIVDQDHDKLKELNGFCTAAVCADITNEDEVISLGLKNMDIVAVAMAGNLAASIMAVAENIKKIQQKIEEVVQSPDSSIELLKTYTGVYMMCHKVYTYAISHALEQIAQVYLKRLGEIQKEATELLQSARHMMNGASSSDRSILETNVQTNQRTLDAVSFYAQYLKRKRAQLERLHAKAEKSANVAVNTYRTVKTSTELLRMMRSSQNEFTQIFNFEPPSVALMYDERLKGEFEQITARLRGE